MKTHFSLEIWTESPLTYRYLFATRSQSMLIINRIEEPKRMALFSNFCVLFDATLVNFGPEKAPGKLLSGFPRHCSPIRSAIFIA